MSFVKKNWKDRISQFPNRRTINDGHTVKRVTVGRDEGVVTEEGTPFDATEMNDLENRIFAAIEQGGGGGGSSGTYDYSELFNKPRINNHELNGNQSAGDLGIASNANELPIESGSATNTKEYIDNGLREKADTSDIPTKTSDLTNDSNFATTSQVADVGNGLKYLLVTNSSGQYYNATFRIKGDNNRVPILIIHNSQLGNIYPPETVSLLNTGEIKTQSSAHVTCSNYHLVIDNGANAWGYSIIIYPSQLCEITNGHS